jgi:hypothetical protein
MPTKFTAAEITGAFLGALGPRPLSGAARKALRGPEKFEKITQIMTTRYQFHDVPRCQGTAKSTGEQCKRAGIERTGYRWAAQVGADGRCYCDNHMRTVVVKPVRALALVAA